MVLYWLLDLLTTKSLSWNVIPSFQSKCRESLLWLPTPHIPSFLMRADGKSHET